MHVYSKDSGYMYVCFVSWRYNSRKSVTILQRLVRMPVHIKVKKPDREHLSSTQVTLSPPLSHSSWIPLQKRKESRLSHL